MCNLTRSVRSLDQTIVAHPCVCGIHRSLHIAVEIVQGESEGYSVDGQQFDSLQAVVDCFSVHKYKDIIMLGDPVPRRALSAMMHHR